MKTTEPYFPVVQGWLPCVGVSPTSMDTTKTHSDSIKDGRANALSKGACDNKKRALDYETRKTTGTRFSSFIILLSGAGLTSFSINNHTNFFW